MGRELRRIKIDFKWEIGKLWKGYINPHECHKCEACDGGGYSLEYEKLRDEWYGHNGEIWRQNPYNKRLRYNVLSWNNNLTEDDVKALIEADRLWDFTRVPINDEQKEIVRKKVADGGNSWLPFNNGYIPTAKEVNEWNLKGMGHDSMNSWCCIKARLKKENLPYECVICKGDGEDWKSEEAKKEYKEWTEYDPPEGKGFQLWNTTTEGHPMSPVFKTLDELCEYLEKEKVSVFGYNTCTKEEWYKMLDDGFVSHKEGNMIFV